MSTGPVTKRTGSTQPRKTSTNENTNERKNANKDAKGRATASASMKAALRARVIRALDYSLETTSVLEIREAIEAPTDIGSAARLLSVATETDSAVRRLDPLAAAVLRGIDVKKRLLSEAGGALDTASVAELLQITRQAVAKQVQRGKLLAIGGGSSGKLLFPAVQFTDRGAIDGLPDLLAAFHVENPWTRLSILLDTDPSLDGRRVIDALRDGDREGALHVVRSFGG